jgi:hypothetical protein
MTYQINIHCMHNSSIQPVRIQAGSWFQLIWRLWRVYRVISQTYRQPLKTFKVVSDEQQQRAVVGYVDAVGKFVPVLAVKATD